MSFATLLICDCKAFFRDVLLLESDVKWGSSLNGELWEFSSWDLETANLKEQHSDSLCKD